MGATDQMIARYMAEIEERQTFIDGIFTAADGKDLTDEQLELVNDTSKRIEQVNKKLEPLDRDAPDRRRLRRADQAARHYMQQQPGPPKQVEYRSAGEYVLDFWRAGLGVEEARQRLETFNRAAAHQTTTDNPGLLPEQILGPVVNFVDDARPLVSAFGPRQLPSGTWSRPRSRSTPPSPRSPRRRPS